MYSTLSFAQIIEFQLKSPIKASEVNLNFDYVRGLLNQKNTPINFNQFNSGSVIYHGDLETEFNKVRTLGVTIPNLSDNQILSEELNLAFSEMRDGVIVYDDVPSAVNSTYSLNESSVLSGELNFINVIGPSIITLSVNPSHGTFEYLGNKQFKYTPDLNFYGLDSFTFNISDGASSSSAIVSLNIISINDAPISQSQNLAINEDSTKEIILFGSDVESSPLTYSITSNPTKGTIVVNGNNVVYTPNLNYFGSDSFSYKVNDGELDSEISTISLNILSVNDAPLISGIQAVSLEQNSSTSGTVQGTDVDSAITYSVVTQGTKGTVSINQVGQYSYSTLANTYGNDSFKVRVSDGILFADLPISVNITGSGLLLVSGAKNYVDGTYAKSCNEYYTKNSGIYTYTNGGDGNYRILIGSTVHSVYCDMTNQGWTMISSGGSHCTSFGQIGATTALNPTVASSCGYMSKANVQVLAGNTSSVRLSTGSASSVNQYVVTSSGTKTMAALRDNGNWHNGARTEFSTTSGWCWGTLTGASASSWPDMYHSTDFAGCVHWLVGLRHGRTYGVDVYSSTWLK